MTQMLSEAYGHESTTKGSEDIEQQIGNKAKALLELNELCDIPSFLPLTHNALKEHLDQEAPNWEKLLKQFQAQQGDNSSELNTDAKATLKELRDLVLKAFQERPFNSQELQEYLQSLPEGSVLMIRSSGAGEDSPTSANAGGSQTVSSIKATSLEEISKAIGVVIASYFSEKSLTQRLLASNDIISDVSLPVLLQIMIREPLELSSDDMVMRSGVMFSNNSGVVIQIAPGFGGYVVDSLGPVDNYFVTEQMVVYPEIAEKPFRIISSDGIETERPNSTPLKQAPSISTKTAFDLAEIAKKIVDKYQKPMDIEFVYAPDQKKIYIVQARPITQQRVELIAPSFIPPEKLSALKAIGSVQKGELITKKVKRARACINDKDSIIVSSNINQALKNYLLLDLESRAKIKAVIVKERGLENSHAAAVFNSVSIPVIFSEETAIYEEWRRAQEKVLVIDPQNQSLAMFPCPDDVSKEEDLYDSGFLIEGYFKSTLSPRATVSPLLTQSLEGVSLELFESKEEDIRIGNLIQKANDLSLPELERKEAFQSLMTYLYKILQLDEKIPIPKDQLYSFLQTQLTTLENSSTTDLKGPSLAIRSIVQAFFWIGSIFKGDREFTSLFQQVVLNAAEIILKLNEMEENEDDESLRLDLLDLTQKLSGLINEPGRKHLFTNSLYIAFQERRAKLNAERMGSALPSGKKEYFIQFVKLKKYMLNKDLAQELEIFLLSICNNENQIQEFANLLMFYSQKNIVSDWLNPHFILQKEKKLSSEELLSSMQTEAQAVQMELQNIEGSQRILDKWKNKIGDWENIDNFEGIFAEFEKEFLPLTDKLVINKDMPPLAQKLILKMALEFAEIFDLSIKSVKSVPNVDPKTQYDYFVTMLNPFMYLMERWVNTCNTRYTSELPQIRKEYSFLTEKRDRDNTFYTEQLQPSSDFCVASATISSPASFTCQFEGYTSAWVKILHKESTAITLEDLYSLTHQNIIESINKLSNNFSQTHQTTEYLFEEIQPLLKTVSSFSSEKGQKARLHYVDYQFPIVQIKYSIPLNHHAAECLVKYNQETETALVSFHFFGGNSGRLDKINSLVLADAMLEGIKIQGLNKNESSLVFSLELTKAKVQNSDFHSYFKVLAGSYLDALNSYASFENSLETIKNRILHRYTDLEAFLKYSENWPTVTDRSIEFENAVKLIKACLKQFYDDGKFENPSIEVLKKLSGLRIRGFILPEEVVNQLFPEEKQAIIPASSPTPDQLSGSNKPDKAIDLPKDVIEEKTQETTESPFQEPNKDNRQSPVGSGSLNQGSTSIHTETKEAMTSSSLPPSQLRTREPPPVSFRKNSYSMYYHKLIISPSHLAIMQSILEKITTLKRSQAKNNICPSIEKIMNNPGNFKLEDYKEALDKILDELRDKRVQTWKRSAKTVELYTKIYEEASGARDLLNQELRQNSMGQ